MKATIVTPGEARAIAREAYIYAFPMVDNLRVQYAYFTDKKDPDFKAPYNTLFNIPACSRRTTRRSRPPTRTRPTRGSVWIYVRNQSCSPCRPSPVNGTGACN